MPDVAGSLDRVLAKVVTAAPEGALSRSGSKKQSRMPGGYGGSSAAADSCVDS